MFSLKKIKELYHKHSTTFVHEKWPHLQLAIIDISQRNHKVCRNTYILIVKYTNNFLIQRRFQISCSIWRTSHLLVYRSEYMCVHKNAQVSTYVAYRSIGTPIIHLLTFGLDVMSLPILCYAGLKAHIRTHLLHLNCTFYKK